MGESTKHFVIVSAPRSGTTYLQALLNVHPDIRCHGEAFNPGKLNLRVPRGSEAAEERRTQLTELRAADPVAFLDRVFSLNHHRPIVGFKMFKSHNPEILERVLNDATVNKVIVFRANSLARYASSRAAKTAGDWKRFTERPRVAFDAAAFIKHHNGYVEFIETTVAMLTERDQPFYFLRSDEIDNCNLMAPLYRFLGTSPPPADAPLPEQSVRGSPDIVSRFSNPDDVVAFLQRRDLMHWAHEGDVPLFRLDASGEPMRAARAVLCQWREEFDQDLLDS